MNLKKSCLEDALKEYHVEANKYGYHAEKKKNLELLKLSNGLKRAAEKKQTELGAVVEERKCLIVVGYRVCLINFLRNNETALSCIQIYEFPLSKLIRNMNH